MKYNEISKLNTQAKEYIDQKKYKEAIDLLIPVIEYDKLNNPYTFALQLLAEAKGKHQEVLKKCDVFIEENEKSYFHYTVKGLTNYDLEEYVKAIEDFNKAIALNSEYAIVYYNRGLVYTNLEDYEKALPDFNKAIALNSKYVKGYIGRGYIHFQLDKYEEAILDYDTVINLNHEYSDIYCNKGNAYYGLEKYEEAILDYEKAISLNPEDTYAYFNKGNALNNLKKYEEAITDYEKAISLGPEDSDMYFNRGNTFNNLEKHEEAIVNYDKAISLNPEDFNSYINRGDAYSSLKDYKRAIIDYNLAIKLAPNDPSAYITRGNFFYALDDFDKAIDDFDKAIELKPDYVNAYNDLGVVYQEIKNYDEAINNFNKCIALDPDHEMGYNNRGNVYSDKEEYDLAILDYNKALELNPNYAKVYFNRGNTYRKQEKYNAAIGDYSKAIDLNPDSIIEVYNNRGLTYELLDNHISAIRDYKKIIDLDPSYKEKVELWIARAKTAINEEEKNKDNEKRQKVSDIIDDIKKTLEYTEDQVCHYTATIVLKELCKGSKLRFSHVALVNDPTEGKTLYDFLKVPSIDRKGLSGFIGSFVEDHNNNTLRLWRAYGRDGEGVSICLNTNILTNKLIETENSKQEKSTSFKETLEDKKLYRVAYIDENDTVFTGGKKNTSLKKKLEKLKKILIPLIADDTIPNEETLEPLVEIQYLFKNAIYQGEGEVRYYELLPNDYTQIKWDDKLSPPTTYIEVDNDIRNSINSVTLGPKAKDASTWMALYKTMLAREGNTDVSVTQSEIPYR